MFISPYETTPCKSYEIDDIKNDLNRLRTNGELIADSERVFFVDEKRTEVKSFTHPIVLKDGKYEMVVTDVRGIAKRSRETGSLIGGADFQYARLRSHIIDKFWMEGNTRDLLNSGDLPLKIFSMLLTENLVRRMNLDPSLQKTLQIITGFYYICLHYDKDSFEDDERSKIGYAKRISRSIGAPVNEVLNVVNEVLYISNIKEYVSTMYGYTESERLSKLTSAMVYTMLGGIWFGPNATEHVGVALEHPPTWAAMVASVVGLRSHQKTSLGKMISIVDRKGDLGSQFVKNLTQVIDLPK